MACHTARSSESRLGFYIPLWYEKKSETFSANCCPWAILIIDDDPDTGETMESGLRQPGCRRSSLPRNRAEVAAMAHLSAF